MRQDRDLEQFLEDAPWMRKWIHECAACHERGYKPELESSHVCEQPVGSKLSHLVTRISLNEAGICEQCCKVRGHSD